MGSFHFAYILAGLLYAKERSKVLRRKFSGQRKPFSSSSKVSAAQLQITRPGKPTGNCTGSMDSMGIIIEELKKTDSLIAWALSIAIGK